jgi:hypothetical protein
MQSKDKDRIDTGMTSGGELVYQLAVLVKEDYVVEFERSERLLSKTEYVQFLEAKPTEKQKLRDLSSIAQSDTFWEDDLNPNVEMFWTST